MQYLNLFYPLQHVLSVYHFQIYYRPRNAYIFNRVQGFKAVSRVLVTFMYLPYQKKNLPLTGNDSFCNQTFLSKHLSFDDL